jgi:two-component system cell cycle response regulator
LTLRRKTVVTVISKIGEKRPRSEACLVVIYGQRMGTRFPVKAGELLIGRSSQAHLQIDHESVSRRHARVMSTEGRIEISDMGSTNGTYVNDEIVTSRELSDGDLIKVGRTILKYLSNSNIETAYHEEIYRLTTIDGLTRCFNRRYLREQLVREVSRATRYKRPLSLVVFDVDHFTQLNEDYGHLAGDAVLAQLGKRVSRRIRREDVFARLSGGEFAIVMPEIDGKGALFLADRVQAIVSEGAFGFDDINIRVNITAGVTALTEINEEEALAVFAGETEETGDTDAVDAFMSDTSDIVTSSENDRFAMVAEALLQTTRQRMQDAKKKA